ncbi:hypothetical protein O3M35_002283 [Rhynocoris fuscipes]|uniref:Uncharacterized protein n=1 Tax=Rhynocoris fuscipes TaxID=488301 RepID=A0AAW1CKV5_9HEMI
MRQAKLLLKSRSDRFTAELLDLDKQTVRMILGMLTGHCRLNKHMCNLRITEDELCRYCLEEEESAALVLCHCDGLAGLQFRVFGEAYPQPVSFRQKRLWLGLGRSFKSSVRSVCCEVGPLGPAIDPQGSQWKRHPTFYLYFYSYNRVNFAKRAVIEQGCNKHFSQELNITFFSATINK